TGRKPIVRASARLFAERHRESDEVSTLAGSEKVVAARKPARTGVAPADRSALGGTVLDAAVVEQKRLRSGFQSAFSDGLLCEGFKRDPESPEYIFYSRSHALT